MSAFALWALAGCTTPGSGIVAEPWELKGPFRAFSDQPNRPRHIERGAINRRLPEPNDADSNGYYSFSLDTPTSQPSSLAERAESAPPLPEHRLFAPVPEDEDRFWYLDLGFRMGITKLGWTENQLDRRLNRIQGVDVLGVFESPTTPLDRKSEFGLTTAYIGVGRRETEWLTWNFYFGTGMGGDKDHQRVANVNMDVNFDYAIYYTGLTVDMYPWGLAKRGRYDNLWEHIRASRPYAVTGFEVGYVRARGGGTFRAAPLTLYEDHQWVEDWLFSYLVGLGWEIPINHRWVFNLQLHYTQHFYKPEEYNSWNLTYALRYEF